MNTAIDLLSRLESKDMDWLLSLGREKQLASGDVLVEQDAQIDSIYMVLTGLFEVYLDRERTVKVAALGAGEIVGELSYLDGHPASATVVAAEESAVLEVPVAKLDAKLAEDAHFAVDFLRSLGGTVSNRMRGVQKTVARPTREGEGEGEGEGQTGGVEGDVMASLDQLKTLVQEIDQRAIKNDGEVSDEDAETLRTGFLGFCDFMNERIGDASGEGELARERIGARVQAEVLPYMLLTVNGERWYAKPRGYAGDFMTIEIMYRNTPEGVGRLGAALDRCFLDVPASVAVRNRRGLLATEISSTLESKNGKQARIASFACGPARELFDVFETLDDKKLIKASLLDIDLQALAFVSDMRDKRKLKGQMKLLSENLVYLATGRRKIDLKDQDLIYSIGLIDYFPDKFVIALLNYIHDALAPGGRVILGNFHPDNTTKALQDYILDWRLIHRDEDDMNRLYSASKFGAPCSRILYEQQRINLFAEGVKA